MVDLYHNLIQPIDSNSDSAKVHLQMSIVYDIGASKLRRKQKMLPTSHQLIKHLTSKF